MCFFCNLLCSRYKFCSCYAEKSVKYLFATISFQKLVEFEIEHSKYIIELGFFKAENCDLWKELFIYIWCINGFKFTKQYVEAAFNSSNLIHI